MVGRKAQSIITRFLRLVACERINYRSVILFGSHARGEATERSDVDLCFVFAYVTEARVKQLESALRLLAGRNGFDIDIIATNVTQYRTNRLSPILHQIRKDGVEVA